MFIVYCNYCYPSQKKAGFDLEMKVNKHNNYGYINTPLSFYLIAGWYYVCVGEGACVCAQMSSDACRVQGAS